MKDRPMAPDEALYELGKEHDAALERLAKAEALLRRVDQYQWVGSGALLCEDIKRFLDGK